MVEPAQSVRPIRVGLTQSYGMAAELSSYPPPGVDFAFVEPTPARLKLVGSPAKGAFLGKYDRGDCDLLEAMLFPIRTAAPWVYSVENAQAAAAFNLLGLPLPRRLRIRYLARLLGADNCKCLMFFSEAGRRTLDSYAGLTDRQLLDKTVVVYPAIREVPDDLIEFPDGDNIELLFVGDFFRKGGVNVLDAFERLWTRYPGVRLTLCCDEAIDFRSPNAALRAEYLHKVRTTPGVSWLGRVSRDRLMTEILPRTSVYLLPTYVEAFGFAVLEAMAFGIPVVATNHFAIPEMIEDGVSGLLIDTSGFDCERLFRGYTVSDIPADFRQTVTDAVYDAVARLIESVELRQQLGTAGMRTARTKFSFRTRNERLMEIYRHALC